MAVPSYKFIRTFQVSARLLSFKAAAEELFMTPSAVSHQIKALEAQLGVELFLRGTRSLTLTDAGVRYLAQMNDILARLESVTDQVRLRFGRSIIRLNVPPFFANQMLLPRLSAFSRVRQETDIRIETSLASPGAHPPEADLSIIVGRGPWEGLTAHELFAQSFVLACSPSFLLEHPIDSYKDMNGMTLLQHEERRDVWTRWANASGIRPLTPGRLIRLDNMSAVVLAAEQGVGIALVPPRLTADRFSSGTLIRLFDSEWMTNEKYVLLHRPEDDTREDLRELTRWILDECRSVR
jgi:LysR family glycine cleavage system transcriptional activator